MASGWLCARGAGLTVETGIELPVFSWEDSWTKMNSTVPYPCTFGQHPNEPKLTPPRFVPLRLIREHQQQPCTCIFLTFYPVLSISFCDHVPKYPWKCGLFYKLRALRNSLGHYPRIAWFPGPMTTTTGFGALLTYLVISWDATTAGSPEYPVVSPFQ